MFKLQPAPTFIAKVEIAIPGIEKPGVLNVEFRYKNVDELQQFFAPAASEGRTDLDALTELIVSWKGADADYSRETLEVLLKNYPNASSAFFETYGRESMGARRKN